MQSPAPGTDPTDEKNAAPNPVARRVRIGFGVLMVAVFLLVVAIAVLRPAGPSHVVPTGSGVPTASVEPTPSVDPNRAGVEAAIRGFYEAVDAGKPVTSSTYVDQKGSGGPVPSSPDTSGTTVFRIARAVVGSATADVYGRESRSVISSGTSEVEFRLQLVEKKWLISSWRVAPLAPIAQTLSLTDVTSSDIVETLLQSRQVGDTTTMLLLTTPAFQAAHSSWFDGSDRTPLFTSYRIVSAAPKGSAYTVTVDEQWLPKPLTSTYTVVLTGGEIRVDAWSWK